MTSGLIVVEGPDDLSALREIFQRLLGGQVAPITHSEKYRGSLLVWPRDDASNEREVRILVAGSRDQVPLVAREQLIGTATAASPNSYLGLCIDPNGQDHAQLQAWLKAGMQAPSIGQTETVDGLECVIGSRSVQVVYLLWDLGSLFDRLSDERNLERVAVEILQKTQPQEGAMVDGFLQTLQAQGMKTTWKTAFRLWAAIRYPDKGAMDQVFGQDNGVRAAVSEVLATSVLFRRLSLFAGQPPTTRSP